MYFKGTITLPDHVDVTDPCYDSDVWCRETINDVIPGEYGCFYTIIDDGEWGKRVLEITIKKTAEGSSELDERFEAEKCEWEEEGVIGVDAGVAGFFNDKPDFDDAEWDTIVKKMYPDGDYSEDAWIMQFDGRDGFFTCSGYGDGSYPVYVQRDKNGKAFSISICFIPEE